MSKDTSWHDEFLAALAQVPVAAYACKAVGVDRVTAYRHRWADPEFAAAWDSAIEDGVDTAEQEAFRRAVSGYEEPVIWQGQMCYTLDHNGDQVPLTIRKHSDGLLIAILKGRRKNVYSERTEVTGADGGPLKSQQVTIITGVPQATFDDLA